MTTKIDFNNFANGALAEKLNREIQRVMENIEDPNTEFKTKRSVTLTLSFSAEEDRELISTDVQVKSKLAPTKSVSARMLLGRDEKGVVGAELKSGVKGQMYMTENGDLADDKGNVVKDEDQREENIVDFRATKKQSK
ncbi:replication terminator protein [Jeotgalibacillus terrae]|uniref:Replication terminator protein n=1 Tax=Jeotgalibacillus terrae TaxID=587735 RepID=A0ABW5ZGC6_9BACL|nr:replication terminator protein [Jeotgalibacillus terrae]MBM7580046.1 hypothetical protein [Jeotgalibacillus terrae]